jgi:hypothetical protein
MLTTREIATILWFIPVAAVTWWKLPGIRAPIRSVVALVLQRVFIIPAAVFTAWMLIAIYIASQWGVWSLTNLKDTLYWLVPGYILLFGAVNAATEERFFRRRIRDAVGLSAFFAFYLSVVTLDLWLELLLVPVLTILSLMAAVGGVTLGGSTALSARAGNLARNIAGLIVMGLVVYTTIRLVQSGGTTDWAELARSLALPAWLTLWAIPFVWVWSVVVEYDSALRHMRISAPDGRLAWKSVLALIVSFRFRLSALHRFAGRWPHDLVTAKGFRRARDVIAKQQAELNADAAAKQKAADDLKRYAGASGLDEHGRPLDKREFKETVEALDHLANSQMGWYRNNGNRYQPDLLEKFGDAFKGDLPDEHGITTDVSNSGQSWYTWRRTPSGLCFAVGAAGPPPDQRFYEGTDPPTGFPKVSAGWLPAHERGPSWEWVYDPDDWARADENGAEDEPTGA